MRFQYPGDARTLRPLTHCDTFQTGLRDVFPLGRFDAFPAALFDTFPESPRPAQCRP